jgi:hypothetical protein
VLQDIGTTLRLRGLRIFNRGNSKNEHFKNVGTWCLANILDMLHAISIVPLTESGPHGMSVEVVEVPLARVRKDLHNPSIRAYLQVWVCVSISKFLLTETVVLSSTAENQNKIHLSIWKLVLSINIGFLWLGYRLGRIQAGSTS